MEFLDLYIDRVPYFSNFIKKTFGISKTIKIAKWFENNWAGIVSNGWFGVFLGSTASVGLFLGIDLDIRHITFASGNFALGIYGANYFVDNWTIFLSIPKVLDLISRRELTINLTWVLTLVIVE